MHNQHSKLISQIHTVPYTSNNPSNNYFTFLLNINHLKYSLFIYFYFFENTLTIQQQNDFSPKG